MLKRVWRTAWQEIGGLYLCKKWVSVFASNVSDGIDNSDTNANCQWKHRFVLMVNVSCEQERHGC